MVWLIFGGILVAGGVVQWLLMGRVLDRWAKTVEQTPGVGDAAPMHTSAPDPDLTEEQIALLRLPERRVETCPSCDEPLVRRKRESVKVFAARLYCNQKCYFAAVRAKKALITPGRQFAPGNPGKQPRQPLDPS